MSQHRASSAAMPAPKPAMHRTSSPGRLAINTSGASNVMGYKDLDAASAKAAPALPWLP
eukprot:m.212863 g.212863  ORF g.212863 m.212863 type:complete len:59 (-) comp18593_c0_seq14:253-429(-)